MKKEKGKKIKPNLPQSLGNLGENQALKHLQSKGYFFIDRNYQTRWGELDLIVKAPDETIVFVEVKARIKTKFGSPLEQIDPKKISHLKWGVKFYLNERRWQKKPVRMDAVGIDYQFENDLQKWPPEVVEIEHVENITGW